MLDSIKMLVEINDKDKDKDKCDHFQHTVGFSSAKRDAFNIKEELF